MLKRESGAESNGKLTHLFIPSKTPTLVPEFAFGHICSLGVEFAVAEYDDDDDDDDGSLHVTIHIDIASIY